MFARVGGGARTNFIGRQLAECRINRHLHHLDSLDVFRLVIGSIVRLLSVIVAVVIHNDSKPTDVAALNGSPVGFLDISRTKSWVQSHW